MKKLMIASAAASLALFSASAVAADAAAGAKKAEVCMDCHMAEDFEGMSADELTTSIKGVLAGEVNHPGVEVSESDAADIAAYFAAEAAK